MMKPRLNKADMWVDDDKKHYQISGEIWSTVGLFLHMVVELKKKRWIISHYKSGRFILKNIRTKEMAIEYMLKLRKVADWNMTLEQLKLKENKKRIEPEIRRMQEEILR